MVVSQAGHGHLFLPLCMGDVVMSVFDDEPSSIIAYTLATVEHGVAVTGIKATVFDIIYNFTC